MQQKAKIFLKKEGFKSNEKYKQIFIITTDSLDDIAVIQLLFEEYKTVLWINSRLKIMKTWIILY